MDEDLQRLLRERQYEAAFEPLVTRYQQKVFRLALSMLRNPAAAEDAAQDVFLRIWRALPYYNESASLSTWIFTITRNTCLSQIRNSSLRAAFSLSEPAVMETAEARRWVTQRETSDPDVRKLVDELPARNRQVLTLYYFQEKSYEEVAGMLDMPIGTVKSYLHRAKRALAEVLGASKRAGKGEAR